MAVRFREEHHQRSPKPIPLVFHGPSHYLDTYIMIHTYIIYSFIILYIIYIYFLQYIKKHILYIFSLQPNSRMEPQLLQDGTCKLSFSLNGSFVAPMGEAWVGEGFRHHPRSSKYITQVDVGKRNGKTALLMPLTCSFREVRSASKPRWNGGKILVSMNFFQPLPFRK